MEIIMTNLKILMNEKYEILKCIYFSCVDTNGEYLYDDKIDQIISDTKISKRTVCRLLKSLEKEGILVKSKFNRKKYCIPNDIKQTFDSLIQIIESKK